MITSNFKWRIENLPLCGGKVGKNGIWWPGSNIFLPTGRQADPCHACFIETEWVREDFT
jgi:hypothetical protein